MGGDAFADIDPQRKAQLDAQLDGYETNILHRQEVAAQAAQRKAEARMNHARAEYEASQGRVMAGIPESDKQVALTTQALAGTPYLGTYQALQQQAREIGGLGAQPVKQQQAIVDGLYARRAQEGASAALDKQISMAERVLSASKAGVKDDALRSYSQRYPGEAIEPIDISTPQAALSSLQKRMTLTQRASAWAGAPVSPLTTDEAQQFGQMIEALPVQQRATALVSIGKAIGPKAVAGLAAQLSTNGQPLGTLMRLGADETNAARPTLEIALKGVQAIKEKTIKGWDTTEGDIRADIATALGDGRGFGSDAARRAAAETAYYIAAGLAAEGRYGTTPMGFKSTKGAQKAVDLAVGGAVIERNGSKIPIPSGMDEGDFDSRIKILTPENFKSQVPDGKVMLGGQEVPLDAFVAAVPDAQLVAVSKGVYNVVTGNRIATNSKGERIIIKAR